VVADAGTGELIRNLTQAALEKMMPKSNGADAL
jgi:hypothetical protein